MRSKPTGCIAYWTVNSRPWGGIFAALGQALTFDTVQLGHRVPFSASHHTRIRRFNRKGASCGQFKRVWVDTCNQRTVDKMATRSHDMPQQFLGNVCRGAEIKDIVTMSGSGIGRGAVMEPSVLRNSIAGTNSPTETIPAATDDFSSQSARGLAKTANPVPVLSSIDALASNLEKMYIDPVPSVRLKDDCSDTESLVERNWSCDNQRCSPQSTRCRFSYKPMKVMSFNCLARSLVDNKYVNNDREVMSWNIRKFAILDVVRHSRAEVVCLQEVDKEEYDNFFMAEFRRLGYRSVHKKKKSPKLDGVCILYLEDRFDVICHKDVEFAVHDADYNRLQVAIILALVDKRTKNVDDSGAPVRDIYIVANTHLLFNKNRGDIKFAQLCAMLSAIKEVESKCLEELGDAAADHPKPAIIMCGDFNFTPQSLLYHFLSKGYVVLRNCNVKLISGQYLMFDTTYKTEQMGHGKSGSTVGNFEGNYIPEIYGTGSSSEWVEPLELTPSLDLFTQMPDWIKRDASMRDLISNYLDAISEHSVSGAEDNANTPRVGSADEARCNKASDLFFCPFNFTSAYSTFDPGLNRCSEPAFTAFHGWQRGCVDYIWYTCDELEVESIYELPAYRDVEANGNLPNKGWPSSDHFSLVSQFKRRPV
ncbi:endonuclease/exonuclease/phosphatase family domain containing protein, putative [Babesia caballi]|uniref:Endonuclease/exonuclease/phosphatase family domain containing protein, putative n=1 Tax=Babesia caballi TaxID=5871 RepID=A0AAV4LZM6_BABCB|nr:endonuclease/exonuclease/phosphatase family domain containing protein, putative [Babesia caballi]